MQPMIRPRFRPAAATGFRPSLTRAVAVCALLALAQGSASTAAHTSGSAQPDAPGNTPPALSSPTPGPERWFRVQMFGSPAGWIHENDRLDPRTGRILARRSETQIRLSRFGTEIGLWSRSVFLADSVPVLEYELSQSPGDTLRLRCRFDGDSLRLRKTAEGRVLRRSLPRPGDLVLPDQVEALFARHTALPDSAGTKLRYPSFVPDLEQVVDFTAIPEAAETLSVGKRPVEVVRWKIRCEAAPGLDAREWRTRTGDLVRMNYPNLGMVAALGERDDVLAGGAAAEIMATTLVPLDRPLDPQLTYRRVRYRITLDGATENRFHPPETPLLRVVEMRAGGVVVDCRRIDPLAGSPPPLGPAPSEEERARALRPTLLIQSDDAAIRAAARAAVGTETTAWNRAVRLCRFVHREIEEKDFQIAFGSAAQTLERKEGDCTEHAILLAALARAAGIPARIVAGLVGLGDQMGYHLWTEVDVGDTGTGADAGEPTKAGDTGSGADVGDPTEAGDTWIGLDAALGRAPVDGSYLPLAVSDLADDSTAPLIYGLLDVVGRIRIEVLETEPLP